MGKNKNKAPQLPQREAYTRMNFLHQASNLLMSQYGRSSNSSSSSDGVPVASCDVGMDVYRARELSRHYNSVMKKVARRLVLRIDRSIKRGVCKCCNASLVSGDTCSIRIRGKRGKHVIVTCSQCGAVRRYYAQVEKADATAEETGKGNSRADLPLVGEPALE